jgi:hypothetical protein
LRHAPQGSGAQPVRCAATESGVVAADAAAELWPPFPTASRTSQAKKPGNKVSCRFGRSHSARIEPSLTRCNPEGTCTGRIPFSRLQSCLVQSVEIVTVSCRAIEIGFHERGRRRTRGFSRHRVGFLRFGVFPPRLCVFS